MTAEERARQVAEALRREGGDLIFALEELRDLAESWLALSAQLREAEADVSKLCDLFVEWLDEQGYNSIDAANVVAGIRAALSVESGHFESGKKGGGNGETTT